MCRILFALRNRERQILRKRERKEEIEGEREKKIETGRVKTQNERVTHTHTNTWK
jgi:hypothetical protein